LPRSYDLVNINVVRKGLQAIRGGATRSNGVTFQQYIRAHQCSSIIASYISVAASNFSTKMASMGSRGANSVYVGNLPYQTSEEAIGHHFSQAGQVTNVKIVYDRETGRMKGFGFCEFSDEAGANNAVNSLNGADFGGRQLRVNYANRN
ncbi:hypothetical protein COOONC_19441, partial [Cooperia oncophora]